MNPERLAALNEFHGLVGNPFNREYVISSERCVTVEKSWVGRDIPSSIQVRVRNGHKLVHVWAGNVNEVLAFRDGKRQFYYTWPNGDVHLARIKYLPNGNICLIKKQKSSCSCSKFTPYYSTPTTEVTPEEWKMIVKCAELALIEWKDNNQR